MALILQKYGGSSVGTLERIRHVAERVGQTVAEGHQVVVVVSAMMGETDRLLGLARTFSPSPDLRETDQLLATGEQASAALMALALHSVGVRATSFTAPQIKLVTDGVFSRARIRTLESTVIQDALATGSTVVIAGFQGVDDQGNLTTLGRGGTDTSAVALAAALGAQACEIYTDVLGVYTADPRICPAATKLDEIAFEEMLEMASLGSKVLQIRSVELAMNHRMPVWVRSTFSDDKGTVVQDENESIERLVVRGVAHSMDEIKVTVRGLRATDDALAKLFGALAKAQINVDVIVQNAPIDGVADVTFTAVSADRLHIQKIVSDLAKELGFSSVEVDDQIGKVSIVGVGMRAHPGVAAAFFEALAAAKVPVQLVSTSEIKVTCVVARDHVAPAVQAVHTAFGLDASAATRG